MLGLFGGYSRTYGSLAGVMIALIFFFVVGLGVVIGAELNAALAESGATALKGEVYTGPYTDELEVEEPQPGEDVEAGTADRGTATLSGLDAGQARADHGPRERPVARLGHCPGAGRRRAPSSPSPIRARRWRSGCGRSPAELGSDLLVDCDVIRHGRARRDVRRARRSDGTTIDFVVHAIGFSDKNELRGKFVDTTMDNFLMTMNISVYSFVAVAQRARR